MAETISYLGQVLLFNALFMSDWVQMVLEVWTYFECADSSIEIQLFVIRAFETGLVVSHPVSVPNFQLQRNRLPRLFRFRFRPRFGRRSTDTRLPFPDCALREKKFGCGTKKKISLPPIFVGERFNTFEFQRLLQIFFWKKHLWSQTCCFNWVEEERGKEKRKRPKITSKLNQMIVVSRTKR